MAQSEMNSEKDPESNNVVLFRTAVTNCFKSIAESVSEEQFISIMTVLKSNSHVAGKLHDAMARQLYESMCADLDDILSEGSLTSDLAKVAKLAQEASNRPDEIAWRPPGDVNLHLRSLDAQKMKEESDKFEKQVDQMEALNERMMKEISERRTRVRMIEERVNRASKALPAVIPSLEKTIKQLHDLADSIDTTNVEIRE